MKKYVLFICICIMVFASCSTPVNDGGETLQPAITQPEITNSQGNTSLRSAPTVTTEVSETTQTVSETESVNITQTIDWDSVVTEINRRLFVKGCATYNDRYFRNLKAYEKPEIECTVYYSQLGLDYTTTQIDRYDSNGANHWYYHYELAHTMENVNIVCEFLEIGLTDLGIVL